MSQTKLFNSSDLLMASKNISRLVRLNSPKQVKQVISMSPTSSSIFSKTSEFSSPPFQKREKKTSLLSSKRKYPFGYETESKRRKFESIVETKPQEEKKKSLEEIKPTLEKEFEDILQATQKQESLLSNYTSALLPQNITKNRYSNVFPFERTRVRLQLKDESDFINANWISGLIKGSEKAYIAAQGPTEATIPEFWRMIWEARVYVIVMLTRAIESGRAKCAEYWPSDSTPIIYDSFRITLESGDPIESDLTQRTFKIYNIDTNETRIIYHFQYTEWPDHGLPSDRSLFLKLIENVNQTNVPQAPILVHCSAGIGRTGTFCTVHSNLEKMKLDQKEGLPISFDVFKTVRELRNQRAGMVQTMEQYIFCFLALQDLYDEMISKGNL